MVLLQRIIQVLPAAQREAIRSLLSQRKKLGDIRTAREEVKEAEKILSEVRGRIGGKVFNPQYAIEGGKISSEDHNKNMEGIFIDLSSLYAEVASIGTASSTRTAAIQSDYLKSRAAVEKLINDARTYSIRRQFREFNEVHIIDFNSARNITTAIPSAQIDPKTRLLELRPITSTRAHLIDRLERVTRIYTNIVGPGIKGELSNNFPPEGMIDQKPETFWGTLVMTDTPTRMEYKLSDSSKITAHGPVLEVYLRFSHIEQLNVVRVLPFSEYPLKIIDIAYKPNSTSEVFYPVGSFDSEAGLDWIEVNFTKVLAAEIRISVLQENPKQVTYHLPKSLVVNTDLFSQILKAKSKKIVDSSFFDSDLANSIAISRDSYQDAIDDLEKILSSSDLSKSSIEELELNSDLLTSLGIVLGQIDSDQSKDLIDKDLIRFPPEEEVIEIRKYEYILGIREIEATYELYAPTCHFESDLYLPQATLSTIQIEVDEERIESKNSWGPFFETSTEWSIDVGEGRILPIHPVNFTGDFLLPAALDERLEFDRSTATAFSRLGSATSDILALRRNGSILPTTGYLATRQTGVIPRMKIELTEDYWDEDSIYTIDYEVSPESYNLDLLSLLSPRSLGEPEVHEDMGPDNDIVLSKYPFIIYDIINRTGNFTKDSNDAVWTYKPPEADISTGHLQIVPTVVDSVNQTLITGSITGYTITGAWGSQSGVPPFDVSNMNSAYFNDPEGFAYYIQAQNIRRNFHVSGKIDPTGLLFTEPPVFTQAQIKEFPEGATANFDTTGNLTGFLQVEFVLGVGLGVYDQVFAFDNVAYTPIEVTVGGQEAKNISDYETLQHPAFAIANTTDREYQFIHAGRRLYFNQPVNNIEIRVNYQWLTEHIKVLSTLRCNKNLNPDLTPKIDEVRILMNTTIL